MRASGLWSAISASALLAVLVAGVPAAAAEPSLKVETVTPTSNGLQVTVRGTGLEDGRDLVPDTLEVRLGGKAADTSASQYRSEDVQTASRSVVLVVDSSGSMKGPRLEAAKRAGQAYLAAVPADVRVALVTFAQRPSVVAAPSTDRALVGKAVSEMTADGPTSLYDAVLSSLDLVGGADERRLLILSDGEDSASTASLEAAVSAVDGSGVGVDAVVFGNEPTAVNALRSLTSAGGGQVLAATSGVEASSAFAAAARAFDTRFTFTAVAPPGLGTGPVPMNVQVATASGTVLTAGRDVLLPERSGANTAGSSKTVLFAGLLVVFVGLASVLVLALCNGDSRAVERRRTREVLAAYTTGPAEATSSAPQSSSVLGSGTLVKAALGLMNKLAARGAFGPRLTERLQRADVRLTAGEWLVVHMTIAVGAPLVLMLVAGPSAVVLGGLLAVLGPHLWLRLKASRRQSAFTEIMPDCLQLIASGLASGYSLPQALDSVVREGQEPVASEFGRALAEARLGVPVETSLDAVAQRMDSDDFRWVVMAIRVQREVGGNLGEVLQTVCHTMRDRASLRRQVKALSAEGRMSAVILVLLPILVGLYMAWSSPEFFSPMYTTTVGIGLLCIGAVSLTLGGLWMKKLVKVEM